MNILVTGATGFIGSHLVPRLLDDGHNVSVLCRDIDKAESLFNDGVHYIKGDITKPETLKIIPENAECIIHLAAEGHVSATSQEAYDKFIETNEKGTLNLIDIAKQLQSLKMFIHFSSTAAMGVINKPVLNEQSVPNPLTPYQKSKFRSEQIVNAAYHEQNFPSVILRPCMVYGPGGLGEFHKFCCLMKKGRFPKIGLGKNLTPIVHVNDVIEATVLTMQKAMIGETYIIASDCSYPLDEVRTHVIEALGIKAPYPYVPAPIALLGAKLIETGYNLMGKEPIVTYRNISSTIRDRTFDISRAKKDLGYSQSISLKQGINSTIEWFKQQGHI
ncbi:MAG: NAD(P)-dependent oxidoreductase [Oscillospiraceae bacterium]|nr:NAD(P)-dependent oxidoreductase [Oscillospiraceae bacterium]